MQNKYIIFHVNKKTGCSVNAIDVHININFLVHLQGYVKGLIWWKNRWQTEYHVIYLFIYPPQRLSL